MSATFRSRPARAVPFGVLAVLLLAAIFVSVSLGAVAIAPARIVEILWDWLRHAGAPRPLDASVLLSIRLPRTLLGVLVGAGLATSGALLQGLFRNPLADPGIIGVSAGAALAACAVIVLGDRLVGAATLPSIVLPIAAFAGGLATTSILYRVATRSGQTSIAVMLLAGIALGACTGAATGLLVTMSDDRQLRDLTFWSLGSLGGANWSKVAIEAVFVVPVVICVPLLARAMNAFALGEAEAYHLGIPVQRTKRLAVVLVSLATGASVAMTGPIGFIGLVVPHLLRLTVGSDNRFVLPASALLGGALLVAADVAARTMAVPAEVPIGIVTAMIGAPFFLWLLLSRSREIAV